MSATLGIQDLRFAYPRSEELYAGLSYKFKSGSLTGITGPSGCGKSTLLYVLGLMLTPTGGAVLLDGAAVTGGTDAQRSAIRAHRIGFVFQDAELDPTRTILDSVLEPCLYAGHLKTEQTPYARELLAQFGLAERADHRPGQISGGQAQRVAVCRALLNQPDVILADEPTGNLDRDNATLVLNALRSAAHNQHRTVLIATHDPFVLEHVDQVLPL